MHFGAVIYTLGVLAAFFGVGMIAPAFVALYYHTGHAHQFVEAGMIVLFIGALMMRSTRHVPRRLGHKDGFLTVALAWVILSVLGAIPFWTMGVAHSFVDGLFESTSGLTTTGATILTDLDHMPPSILFWRSMQEWLGGMGIILLAVAVMPLLGVGGMQLFKAETPGPVKDKLTTRIAGTAKVLWYLYLVMTLACTVAYWLGGMRLFDAINHAMCTIAIGGFSTHDASFGYFEQPVLHVIAVVFMILAGINFRLHFASLLHGFSLRVYFQDEEFRVYMAWLFSLFVLIGGLTLMAGGYGWSDWDKILFNTISIATTSGFAVSDYSTWPPGTTLLFLIAMFIGACAGSTGGGMKVVRILLLFRQGMREIYRLIHPHAVFHVRLGERRVAPDVTQALWGFAVLFLVSYVMIALLVAMSGVDIITAFTASAACISNTGPGFGMVGPASTYLLLPDMSKGVLMFGMILGRLEIFTFFVLLIPAFWRK